MIILLLPGRQQDLPSAKYHDPTVPTIASTLAASIEPTGHKFEAPTHIQQQVLASHHWQVPASIRMQPASWSGSSGKYQIPASIMLRPASQCDSDSSQFQLSGSCPYQMTQVQGFIKSQPSN
jgi:hypothetical protein